MALKSWPRRVDRSLVSTEEFSRWAEANPGVEAVHHYNALRACWPFLWAGYGKHKVLDVGPNPIPWLRTFGRFAGSSHKLWACRQGSAGPIETVKGIHQIASDFDVWSPLANHELPNVISERGFTLVTLLHVIEHVYHPDPLLRALADTMKPRAILMITARNVARLSNIMHIVNGGGLAGHVDGLINRDAGVRAPVREYCWQELNDAALQAGFLPISHEFYDDPAQQSPDGTRFDASGDRSKALRKLVEPLIAESGQLQSDMILLFRKADPNSGSKVLRSALPWWSRAREIFRT